MKAEEVIKAIKGEGDKKRALGMARYFKTGKGEYGEGDLFWGLKSAQIGEISRQFKDLSISETEKLLHHKIHECRTVALAILKHQFAKGDEKIRKNIFEIYLKNTKYINNWDLVDISAPEIIGGYLEGKDKKILEKLARSESLWERRIAIISTFWEIGEGNPRPALKIAKMLLKDKEDLIHKATGWMLREIGKRCSQKIEEEFLNKYATTMPRTMLRYAIERFSESRRHYYLKLKSE